MLVPLAEHILLEKVLGDVVAVFLISALLGGSLIVVALGEHDDVAAGAAVDNGRVARLAVGALEPLGDVGLDGGADKIGLLLDLGALDGALAASARELPSLSFLRMSSAVV